VKEFVGAESLTPPESGSSVTIGTFDGLHVGHRTLIAKTLADAHERNTASTVVTWDRHPAETLRPDKAPKLLTTPERKVELIEETGIDQLIVLPFTKELSLWPPERFVEEILAQGLGTRAIFVGHDWRFGHQQSGDVDLISTLGTRLGFETEGVELEEVAGGPVSSSRVRETVARGDMETARLLLGRNFDLEGHVLRGDRRGTELGFPTANIDLDPKMAHPPRGVYAGRARARDIWYAAAINLGVNPQFGGDPETTPLRVEAYLLDFSGDLYGQEVRIEFHSRLRDELKFKTVDDLLEQMQLDVEASRRFLRA
jgi:riboflavin kinase / FMN adenylyltransferase